MAPKKITVEGVGVKLSNDNEFYFWLSKKQVESLVDSEGDEVVGFESLEDGGTYTLGPPQQQQQQYVAVAPSIVVPNSLEPATAAATTKTKSQMILFFESTDLSQFTFNECDYFINMTLLSWSRVELGAVLWRSCYSYILCSTIAFFEDGYAALATARREGTTGRKKSMALTGVQGTGKSVIGAIIPLFMAKAFGWCVKYTWNGTTCMFGDTKSSKQVHIIDFSQGKTFSPTDDFVLVVTSARKERWHQIAQQETWIPTQNFIIMDTVPREELASMAAHRKLDDAVADANYAVAGGVARLCLEANTSDVKSIVKAAVRDISLVESIRSLAKLSDQAPSNVREKKIYPGLIAHLRPTDPFRNQFQLKVCSEFVENELKQKLASESEAEVEKLMKDLIGTPKGRGFAGLIWEPLFTRKSQKKAGELIVAGMKLPSKGEQAAILIKKSLGEIYTFEFKTLDEFVNNVKELIERDEDVVASAKAIDDNFVAIDGVLVIVSNKVVRIIGLQMTVAKNHHALRQQGVKELVNAANKVGSESVSVEVWFLQPDCCLTEFGFINLQPMTFETAKTPVHEEHSTSLYCRKRRRTAQFGDDATGDSKKFQSNDKAYWDDSVKAVTQFVAVARFTEAGSGEGVTLTSQAGALLQELNRASTSCKRDSVACIEPASRPWKSTERVLNSLIDSKQELAKDFIEVLKRDIENDKNTLMRMCPDFRSSQELG